MRPNWSALALEADVSPETHFNRSFVWNIYCGPILQASHFQNDKENYDPTPEKIEKGPRFNSSVCVYIYISGKEKRNKDENEMKRIGVQLSKA